MSNTGHFERISWALRPFIIKTLFAACLAAAPLSAANTIPDRLTDDEYRELIAALSEPDGAFQFENLLSNESDFPHVLAELQRTAPRGGVYLGVGPEQNFTYIAALRPKMAFIIDIRQQNVVQHLMYKALFELAEDRATFVSRLFSRKRPQNLLQTATAADLFAAFHNVPADPEAFEANLSDIEEALSRKHGFVLSADDLRSLRHVYTAFRDFGPSMDYNSRGGIPGGRGGSTPTYARLMTETDNAGREWSYLANEENYRYVRDLEQRNLIVPLTGDFGGPKTIRAVGQYLKAHGAVVSAFYVSNVEGYLFQGGDRQGNTNGGADAFYANAASLPLGPSSVFVRWIPSVGGFGGGTSILTAPILSTVEDFNAGRLGIAQFFPGRNRALGRPANRGIAGPGMGLSGRIDRAGPFPVSLWESVAYSGIVLHAAIAAVAFGARYFLWEAWRRRSRLPEDSRDRLPTRPLMIRSIMWAIAGCVAAVLMGFF